MIIQNTQFGGFQLSISQSCQVLGVSRSGYWRWQSLPRSVSYNDMNLRNEIQEIALEFPGYGYRRITVELRNRGYKVNHK